MAVLVAVEAIVIALLAVLVVGLLRSHAEILRRLHDAGIGLDDEVPAEGPVRSPVELRGTKPGVPGERPQSLGTATDLVGTTPGGAATAVAVTGTEHSSLLVFLSSGCLTCRGFWEAFAAGEADRLPGHDTRLVVLTKGPEAESVAAVAELAPRHVTTLMSSQAWADYGVPVSPYVILVDGPTGTVVGEGAAATWGQVADLLGQAAADAGTSTSTDAGAREAAARGMAAREARAEEELARAGIGPGHPALYPTKLVEDDLPADGPPGPDPEPSADP